MTVALFSPLALSAVVAIAPGPGIAVGSGGITTASSFVGTFSAGAFGSHFTTPVGGTPVTMPATMRMAANAGSFAATAVRGSPGLIGPAVAAWLIGAGIEWLIDQWVVRDITGTPPSPYPIFTSYYAPGTSKYYSTLTDMLADLHDICVRFGNTCSEGAMRYYPPNMYQWTQTTQSASYNIGGYGQGQQIGQACPAGYTLNGSSCSANPKPATDADWANLPQPLPDPAAEELAKKGVPLPLRAPEYNPAHHDVPLGDPYVDPSDNVRKREQARVTPQSDGQTARVDVVKVPVNPDGTPANDPNGNPEPAQPVEKSDPCELNPSRVGCLEADTPDAPDITENDKTISITPQGGFGADTATCPADKSYSLRLMGNVALSWEPACQVASGMRLIVIAMAWVSAILIAIGITKRYG
ncbi:virulence factor TspB C-terminal domain-related protein [Azonexus sp.]|uniref:virulence factor TspB C-terminal domain-related protein n=1 Tax=Azonexus sp. TaxID=1872668 RepID=UPI0035B0BAEB